MKFLQKSGLMDNRVICIECATKTSSLQTIESLIKEVKLKKNSSPAQPPQPVQPARRKHPKFAGFNDIVQVQFLPGSGRFMVADRDIQVQIS